MTGRPVIMGENEMITSARQSANFGIQDQLMALQWIQEQILNFGGDPDRVTVFGESAGGFSICALLSVPNSAPLFQQAIIQSGGGCSGFPLLDMQREDSVETTATSILSALNCDELGGTAQCHPVHHNSGHSVLKLPLFQRNLLFAYLAKEIQSTHLHFE